MESAEKSARARRSQWGNVSGAISASAGMNTTGYKTVVVELAAIACFRDHGAPKKTGGRVAGSRD